jgi:uncharacterized protein (TIGR00730 family)
VAAICVFCSSSSAIPAHYLQLATDVGAEIARRGDSLVSGGGAVSMMGAVARAARAGGAHTLGVIPRQLLDLEVGDTDADEFVVVDTMRERKRIMDDRADAFMVLPGGLGTLEEMFEVWTARTLGMHSKPVVVLDPDGVFDPLWTLIDSLVVAGFARSSGLGALARVTTVEEAFAAL